MIKYDVTYVYDDVTFVYDDVLMCMGVGIGCTKASARVRGWPYPATCKARAHIRAH